MAAADIITHSPRVTVTPRLSWSIGQMPRICPLDLSGPSPTGIGYGAAVFEENTFNTSSKVTEIEHSAAYTYEVAYYTVTLEVSSTTVTATGENLVQGYEYLRTGSGANVLTALVSAPPDATDPTQIYEPIWRTEATRAHVWHGHVLAFGDAHEAPFDTSKDGESLRLVRYAIPGVGLRDDLVGRWKITDTDRALDLGSSYGDVAVDPGDPDTWSLLERKEVYSGGVTEYEIEGYVGISGDVTLDVTTSYDPPYESSGGDGTGAATWTGGGYSGGYSGTLTNTFEADAWVGTTSRTLTESTDSELKRTVYSPSFHTPNLGYDVTLSTGCAYAVPGIGGTAHLTRMDLAGARSGGPRAGGTLRLPVEDDRRHAMSSGAWTFPASNTVQWCYGVLVAPADGFYSLSATSDVPVELGNVSTYCVIHELSPRRLTAIPLRAGARLPVIAGGLCLPNTNLYEPIGALVAESGGVVRRRLALWGPTATDASGTVSISSVSPPSPLVIGAAGSDHTIAAAGSHEYRQWRFARIPASPGAWVRVRLTGAHLTATLSAVSAIGLEATARVVGDDGVTVSRQVEAIIQAGTSGIFVVLWPPQWSFDAAVPAVTVRWDVIT